VEPTRPSVPMTTSAIFMSYLRGLRIPL
jgi:hypothetical protein